MRSPKIIGGVLIIGIAIFVFLVVFGNSLEKDEKQLVIETGEEINIELKSESTPNLRKDENGNGIKSHNSQNDNLINSTTKKIGEKIAKSITDLNKEGLVDLNDKQFAKALNPQKVISDVLREELKEIEDLSRLTGKPEITINSERIIVSASKEDKEQYLADVKEIYLESKSDISNLNIVSPNDFEELSQIYKKAFEDLEKIKVPQSLLSVHREGLALLLWQFSIWQSLGEVNTASLGAVVALKQYEQVREELVVFNQMISGYINENQLAIQWQ